MEQRKTPLMMSPGLNGLNMTSSDRWRRSSEFLWQDETAWPTNPAVPEIACEDEEVKNQVKCCVSNVQYDAGYRERHGMPRAEKEQESEDPMICSIELFLLASSEKECGLATSLQGLTESEDEK